MASLWSESVKLPEFPRLEKDIKTDVLIIGGGMAGILCAYMLEKAGVPYVLVEADVICSGTTKNTTAKLTYQHGLIYDKLLSSSGIERARMYLNANQAALDKYAELCRSISCDFKRESAYVYSLDNPQKIEAEQKALQKLGYSAELFGELPLPFAVSGALCFREQAQFHPLKFIAEIAQNLNIYEHTRVRELAGKVALTGSAKISADNIIVATHFPFLNKHGSYFLKLYQHRSYVLALENAPEPGGMYIDEAEKGLSFRSHENLLLLGGGSHRTGKSGGSWQELEEKARHFYPTAKVKHRWAAQDCMSLDSVPYIGRYSKNTPGLYVAAGFNKWGMTSAMVSAMLLSDMITGKHNPYAPVFSPSRSILSPQLAVNAFTATASLLTPSKKRCPHLGCALKWNAAEHSWDCACHGSRFTEGGELIDNPATGNLKQP